MDITYAVGRLSQHLINLTIRYWNAVLRVFRYFRGTTDYCLVFKLGSANASAKLEGFTNANYASAQDRILISAYTFIFNRVAIA
jgi:hypothetical protein